ncbi:scavenger receptor cysteine-rich type 1 protein M130-like [Trichomycterus rosablanca]|uniref:scavenger receptor cysteine-rich type 1 protein M130-like n=1 Tax=Trichomycterus rosablanca TaxID=2290929 RepID=UPI002F3598A9
MLLSSVKAPGSMLQTAGFKPPSTPDDSPCTMLRSPVKAPGSKQLIQDTWPGSKQFTSDASPGSTQLTPDASPGSKLLTLDASPGSKQLTSDASPGSRQLMLCYKKVPPESAPVFTSAPPVGAPGSMSVPPVCASVLSLAPPVGAPEVRLVGGGSRCSGRVEVHHGKTWYTVCDADFDQQDAEVVCRDLGCGLPVEMLGANTFGRGEHQVWTEELQCRGNESQIHLCPTSATNHTCSHSSDVGLVCAGGVRLVDGGSRCAGRVEVLHRGQWGTVCSAGWDMDDAAVVCRELDCGEAVAVLGNAHFGPGSGPIWMENVTCSGSESTLKNCLSAGWGNHYCDHHNDASVMCSGKLLIDGPHRCSGRVEVHHGKTWYTVCDADFDQQDAEVVCRELNCGLPVEVLGAAAFGRGEHQVWTEELQCRGNESQIHLCPTSPTNHTCSHSSDVGLVCAGGVRLVDGGSRCAGRVEVLHDGRWGTVCGDDWDLDDAAVVCRELDCGEAVAVLGDAHFGPGSGPIWMDDVGCTGSESTLRNCRSTGWGMNNCDHSKDAGVMCSEVRLVGGGLRCSGRVEVHHGKTWYTVCDADFDQQDAEVVCRELGCGLPVEVLGAAAFSRGEHQVWTEELQCRGNESKIHLCPTSPTSHTCSHSSDVGLVCAGRVRLVDGSRCSGRVEVHHGKTWYTVCDADFDQQDAEVVCRELGCGLPVEVLGAAASGRGEHQVWTEELQCRGNESQIHLCPTSPTNYTCSHSSDVGLVCAGSVRLVDGGSRCAGRVEVVHAGQWGTVCETGQWGIREAAVVCRELDCGEAVDALGNAHFGPGSGPIWMNNVVCSGLESALKSCVSQSLEQYPCQHNHDTGVICSEHRKSRLVDGSHRCSGRVEVVLGKTWTTVCDADFDQQDAEVVCRELDCGLPVEVLGAAAFGRGEHQVWTEELQCRGNESQIHLCPTSPTNHTCSHSSDVGLICSGHTEARLVDGPDSCSGRVELQYLSDWGTVCAGSWNMKAASVLCAHLNCGSAVAVLEADRFGEGSVQIWSDVFDCKGNETHLSKCPVSSWSRAACSHKQDAGVICTGSSLAFHDGRVRLTGGSECQGEVEVYFGQDWRKVLLDSWSLAESSVLCRQLSCGSVLNFSSSPSTTEHNHTCGTAFNCSVSEEHLGNCSSAKPANCSSRELLSITCSGKYNQGQRSIKLVGSGGDCAGRLEVFHSGSWGTVCGDLWDIKDAQVVCRELQCGVALSTHIPAWFGPGTGSILLNKVECEGNETSLWNCRFKVCEENECGHQEDVGVVCSEFKEIRLTGGCEGNLEVFYNGTWGNVCFNGMDDGTAGVICRELNCGRTGSLSLTKARLESAPNWLDHVKCRKHDSTLLHCPSSPWGQNECDSSAEVAHIKCSGRSNDGKSVRTHGSCLPSSHLRYCSNHLPLRLIEGKGSCSGRLEVYYDATWGSVCDDQWDIRDAQVVCRQLGCGGALSADRNATFGAGEGTIWLNRVKCRGDEIHLWNCHHSLKYQTDCTHKQDAGVTCAEISASSTTTPTTTTIITEAVTQTMKRTANPEPPSAAALSTPPLALILLGTLLFLALVLLVVMFFQNRGLRRGLYNKDKSVSEPVYEDLDHRYPTRQNTERGNYLMSTKQKSGYKHIEAQFSTGSLLSESQHSGYEDVDEELLSVKSGFEDKAEYYDDAVTTNDLISDTRRVDTPEDYDDVMTAGLIPDNVAEDEAENYDDAITADQKSQIMTEETPPEDHDDAVTMETKPNLITEESEDYDDVMGAEQEVGGAEDYDDVEEEPQRDPDHVTQRRRPMSLFRK